MLKVFLSSTAKDLEPYRAAVDAVIRKLDGLHSIRMEDWTARPNAPRETCEAEARGSDLFIGILGHCYGSSPPGDTRSFTEIKYDTAADLPRLMFVATNDFPVAASLLKSQTAEPAQRQEAF